MKVYLDVCCYNRPFDDHIQDRVRLEAEAIMTIIARCRKKNLSLVVSTIVDYEVHRIPDDDRRQKVLELVKMGTERVKLDTSLEARAIEIAKMGFKTYDAYHIACAEKGEVDILLTTDDRLLRKSQQADLQVKIENPLKWIIDVGE